MDAVICPLTQIPCCPQHTTQTYGNDYMPLEYPEDTIQVLRAPKYPNRRVFPFDHTQHHDDKYTCCHGSRQSRQIRQPGYRKMVFSWLFILVSAMRASLSSIGALLSHARTNDRSSPRHKIAGCTSPPDRPSPVGGEEQHPYCRNVVSRDAIVCVAEIDAGDGVRAAEAEEVRVRKQQYADRNVDSRGIMASCVSLGNRI